MPLGNDFEHIFDAISADQPIPKPLVSSVRQELNELQGLGRVVSDNVIPGTTKLKSDSPIVLIGSRKITTGLEVATFDFQVPTDFDHLQLWVRAAVDNASNTVLELRFNDDSGTNYEHQSVYGSATTAGAAFSTTQTSLGLGAIAGTTAPAGSTSSSIIWMPHYSDEGVWQTVHTHEGFVDTPSTVQSVVMQKGWWKATDRVAKLTIFNTDGYDFSAGSIFSLYGLRG